MNVQGAAAASTGESRVVVSASIAYDYIMAFPGSFGDHILPDKTHVLSVSFLVNTLKRQRGGVAGNIAYSLALLGERPMLAGAGGADFGPYRQAFEELGIDLTLVMDVPSELTASAFMMTDLKDNQIAAFYPGAGGQIGELSLAEAAAKVPYGIVGATMPEAMRRHAHEIAAAGARLIYDPSQQIVALSAEDLVAGIDDAWALVGNDYEYAMIEQKTGLSIDALKERVSLLVVTYGEEGSEFLSNGASVRIPAAKTNDVRDPTGAGDAFRAGMIKGLLLEAPHEVTGRVASLAATYAVELHGTQEHRYTSEQFVERFECVYPDFRGAIKAEQFRA
jgi:adenosine kinase